MAEATWAELNYPKGLYARVVVEYDEASLKRGQEWPEADIVAVRFETNMKRRVALDVEDVNTREKFASTERTVEGSDRFEAPSRGKIPKAADMRMRMGT